MTAKYERLKGVAVERYNDKNMCTVIALAVNCDVSYGKAQAAMRRAGREDRKGANVTTVRAAAAELGFGLFDSPMSGKTIRTHGKMLAKAENQMMFTVTHCAAGRDGVVHDWAKSRTKRLIGVYDVFPIPVMR